MATFQYKAYDSFGASITDTVDAESEDQAFRKLAAKGYTVASLTVARRSEERAASAPRGKGLRLQLTAPRVKLEDLVVVSRQLAIMIGAGVPVTDALVSIAEHCKNPTMSAALTDV